MLFTCGEFQLLTADVLIEMVIEVGVHHIKKEDHKFPSDSWQ